MSVFGHFDAVIASASHGPFCYERVVCDFKKLMNVPINSRPVFKVGRNEVGFAAHGGYTNFRNYSTNYSDFWHYALSCHSLISTYEKQRYSDELSEKGKKKIGIAEEDKTPMYCEISGNCVSVGKDGNTSSNIMATAAHCTAEYIDENGLPIDKNNKICGTNKESSAKKIYKLTRIVIDGENERRNTADVLDIDAEADLACIASDAPYPYFMEADHDILNDPEKIYHQNQLLMMGVRVFHPKGVASDGVGYVVKEDEIAELFGPFAAFNMTGLSKPIDNIEAMLPYQEQHIKDGEFIELNENGRFIHLLSALPGHSGAGLSVKPGKIFGIHHSGDASHDVVVIDGGLAISKSKYNMGSLINDSILKHIQ